MCEHAWTNTTAITELNLINCKGEVGPIDMFPVFSHAEPGPGTVCYLCYQIWGERPGVLLQELVLFDQKMRELDQQYKKHI